MGASASSNSTSTAPEQTKRETQPQMTFKSFGNLIFPQLRRDFDAVKRLHKRLEKKVKRRMREINIKTLRSYYDYVQANEAEFKALDIILFDTTPTRFFVDTEEYELVLKHFTPKDEISAWSIGCCGGEEIFTFKIIAQLHDLSCQWRGSDISEPSIERAQKGEFQFSTIRHIPSDLLEKHFTQ